MIGVSIGPGLIPLTQILQCFRSTVRERANDRIASLGGTLNASSPLEGRINEMKSLTWDYYLRLLRSSAGEMFKKVISEYP